MLVSFKLQMESDILTRWAAWNAVPLDMNGLGQFRDGETHVSPLAGLAFFWSVRFPTASAVGYDPPSLRDSRHDAIGKLLSILALISTLRAGHRLCMLDSLR